MTQQCKHCGKPHENEVYCSRECRQAGLHPGAAARQRQMRVMLKDGMTPKQIGRKLGISAARVRFLRKEWRVDATASE